MDELVRAIVNREGNDVYGHSRVPESVDKVPYGRFRNVYLYITDKCQLRCGHCYMGDRLEVGAVMPFDVVEKNLVTWRKMGGSKLSILGGEPTLHLQFGEIVRLANDVGYERVILNTNGLAAARLRLRKLTPADFSYVQVSVDGASSETHDRVRGEGTFNQAWQTTRELCGRGFDTRIICTVNRVNISECLNLLEMADQIGVNLVKYHVFSGIGLGNANAEWIVDPKTWIAFYRHLQSKKGQYRTKIWFQPTYADRDNISQFESEGFRGCIGRTMDRISIFPDGRAYICSYLFDTTLNYAMVSNTGDITLNRGPNEFELFTSVMNNASCSSCKSPRACMGGCPAEKIVMGQSSCSHDTEIIPVCRLWKSSVQ